LFCALYSLSCEKKNQLRRAIRLCSHRFLDTPYNTLPSYPVHCKKKIPRYLVVHSAGLDTAAQQLSLASAPPLWTGVFAHNRFERSDLLPLHSGSKHCPPSSGKKKRKKQNSKIPVRLAGIISCAPPARRPDLLRLPAQILQVCCRIPPAQHSPPHSPFSVSLLSSRDLGLLPG